MSKESQKMDFYTESNEKIKYMVGGLASWLAQPNFTKSYVFVLQNLTLISHAHRRQVVLSTTWSFAKVFVFVQRKFLSSGCSPPSLFWLARALLSSFLSFKILYIYAMKKGIELRSSVTHSHAWKMCATLKNCISSFLTLQQSLWALLLPTENASFFSESITVTFYAPLPVPKRLSFSTLTPSSLLHTSARSSFFSGSFAPATRHGTK